MSLQCGRRPVRINHGRGSSSALAMLSIIAAMATLMAAGPAFARSDTPLTLAETGDLASRAEPGQQALEARAAAYGERAVAAAELPDPMLRIGLNNFPIESGGFSTEGMTQATIGFRQTFPAGDKLSLSSAQFGHLATSMSASAGARALDVRTAAWRAWLELYFLDRADELILESRPLFADLAEITLSLYSVGRRKQQDVLRAELELSRLDDRLIDNARRRGRARSALAEWIGEDARRPIASNFPQWERLPPLAELQDGLAVHPALVAAGAQVEASSVNVEIANERGKPDWVLDVSYGYREGFLPNGEPRSDMVTVGVSVGLPFFSTTSIDSNVSAALKEQTAARSSRLRLERELFSRLEAQYAEWQELTRRLDLYETRILAQAEAQADAALLAYQSDAGDFADVMRAYIDHLNNRIEYLRLTVERAQSYAAIANLGGLPQ
jgi:outer membrane protein TolC